jgi:hypothetical protein
MYRDEIWYRKLEEAVRAHQDDLTSKQWATYQIDQLLRIADRVREHADGCETCRSFQHTLTRLEEELQELPGSKAQRQYQAAQLRQMGEHFVAEHHLVPPRFYLRRWLRIGVFAGLAIGLLAALVAQNATLVPVVTLVIVACCALYGFTRDQEVEREHRRI